MKPHHVEATLVLRRIYDAPLARVWRAWTEVKELGQWYIAGDDHIVHFAEGDIRVGGFYRVGFGPPGSKPYVETGRYTEIVPMKRLAWTGDVTHEGEDVHAGCCTVEFADLGGGRTQVVVTSTGEEVWNSAVGWIPCLENLARYFAKGG